MPVELRDSKFADAAHLISKPYSPHDDNYHLDFQCGHRPSATCTPYLVSRLTAVFSRREVIENKEGRSILYSRLLPSQNIV